MATHSIDEGGSGLDADPNGETSIHLRAAISGDHAGLVQAIRRLTPVLLALAQYRLRALPPGLLDPPDLVNEIWLRVLPHLDEIRPLGGRITPVVLQYLGAALRRRVRDLLETQVRRGGPAAPLDQHSGVAAETQGVVTQVIAEEQRGLVHRAIEELEPRDREIVLLRGIEQNPTSDVAAVTGLSEDAVRQRYHRALKQLRQRLPDSLFHELD